LRSARTPEARPPRKPLFGRPFPRCELRAPNEGVAERAIAVRKFPTMELRIDSETVATARRRAAAIVDPIAGFIARNTTVAVERSVARLLGIDRLDIPVREQPGKWLHVTIGRDSWIGDRAVVLAEGLTERLALAGRTATALHLDIHQPLITRQLPTRED